MPGRETEENGKTFVAKVYQFIRDPYKFIKEHPSSHLRYFLIPISWAVQRMLYADKTENIFKILLDLILILIFYLILINFADIRVSLLSAFIIAHTFNWLFNSGVWTLFSSKFGLKILNIENTPQIHHIKELQEKIKKEKSILCAAVYGSISRTENRKSSDLDVRIVRKSGIINGFRACFYAFIEKSKAFISKFPLDLYVVDCTKHLSKLRKDEMPVVLYDPEGIIEKLYPRVTYLKNECA